MSTGYKIAEKEGLYYLTFPRTVHVNDGERRIATVDYKTVENGVAITSFTDVVRYQYDNHLGSACLELDANALTITYEEYHPFGTSSYKLADNDTEVKRKRYRYVGKERDEETGLYYYGARYYAAWIGRWTAVEPLKEKYSNLSTYCYCANNPINYLDPNGMDQKPVKDNYNGKKSWISSGVGTRTIKSNKTGKDITQYHPGIDFNFGSKYDDYGAPITSTHDGYVSAVYENKNSQGYGVEIISSEGTVKTRYYHMKSLPDVKKGNKIKEGQQIGYIGDTFGSTKTDSHLHYELYIKKGEGYEVGNQDVKNREDESKLIDPQKLLKEGEVFSIEAKLAASIGAAEESLKESASLGIKSSERINHNKEIKGTDYYQSVIGTSPEPKLGDKLMENKIPIVKTVGEIVKFFGF